MPPVQILFVEDEFLIALLKQRQLENYGYSVQHVSSGEDAVECVLQNSTNIDLILMDINLGSGIDGKEAAQKILSIKDIPIVFFSSHSDPEIIMQTEKITSYGYVLKDSSIVVLDASIKMALKLFETKNKLNRSEEIRKNVFQNSRIPTVVLETESYSIIDCNLAAIKLFECNDKTQFLGRNLLHYSTDSQHNFANASNKLSSVFELVLQEGAVVFEWCFIRTDNSLWDAEIQMLSFSIEDQFFLQLSIFDITEKRKFALSNELTKKRVALQRSSIAKMVSDPLVFGDNLVVALNRVNEYLSQVLDVRRCGIWILNDQKSELKALSIFDAEDNSFSSGITLMTSDFPNYFEAILAENRIYSEDAQNDPRTHELKENYLEKLGITALLDAGFFVNGQLKGVICSEHEGHKRKWHPDEESFVSTVAAIVGQIFIHDSKIILLNEDGLKETIII